MLQLFNNPNGRGGNEVMLSFAKLYQIIRDRLEYMGPNPDFDAVCQRACVEVEKAMGTYPNVPTIAEGPTETPETIAAAAALEPAAWVVMAEPDFKWHFALSKDDAEHTANNFLTYAKGCTSASIAPLFAGRQIPIAKRTY